jgi:hypothetical protein
MIAFDLCGFVNGELLTLNTLPFVVSQEIGLSFGWVTMKWLSSATTFTRNYEIPLAGFTDR